MSRIGKGESLSSAASITVETSHYICKGIKMSDAKRPISLIWGARKIIKSQEQPSVGGRSRDSNFLWLVSIFYDEKMVDNHLLSVRGMKWHFYNLR